jgi:carbon storage regulator CsrA
MVVKILRVEGDTVKVGIEAPADVPVHREEVYLEMQRSNQAALTGPKLPLPKLADEAGTPPPLAEPDATHCASPQLVTKPGPV